MVGPDDDVLVDTSDIAGDESVVVEELLSTVEVDESDVTVEETSVTEEVDSTIPDVVD